MLEKCMKGEGIVFLFHESIFPCINFGLASSGVVCLTGVDYLFDYAEVA